MLPILLLSYTGLAFAASYRSSFTQFVPFHLPFLPHSLFPAFTLLPLQVSLLKNPYRYGSTDGQSPNCNTATAACGFYSYPGYNAAVSQNLYGEGPGAGAGPQCGKCWQLVPEKDGNGNPIFGANTIVVKVNNLCPAQGNPLCSQDSLTSQNYLGTILIHFPPCFRSSLVLFPLFVLWNFPWEIYTFCFL